MKFFRSILKTSTTHKSAEEPPRYPPFVKGLPATNPERLLSDHDELTKKIFQAVRASNQEYKTLYLPLMTRFAAFVHLLPASENHHHRGAGGLLRHGLEVAFWSIQQCENAIYALESRPEIRRQATLRWEFAVFTAGLCHDVGKCVSDMAVVDRSGKYEWNPFEETLYEWLIRFRVDRYHIRWRDSRHGRHEKIAPLVLDRVFPQKGRAYLAEVGPEPLEGMISALNGAMSGGTENQVYTMINKADRASVQNDIRNQPMENTATGSVATPVIVSLFDAMRRLIRRKTWTVNSHGSQIWFTDNRIFLSWPRAANDIIGQIDRDHVSGIPRDPDTIADILFDRELAIPYHKVSGEPLRRYWHIVPAIIGSKDRPQKLMVLELTNPSSLLDPVPESAPIQILDPINDSAEEIKKKPVKAEPTIKTAAQKAERKTGIEPVKDAVPLPSEPSTVPPPEDLADIFLPEFEKQTTLDLFPEDNPIPVLNSESKQPRQDEVKPTPETVPAAPKIVLPDPGKHDLFSEDSSISGEVILALADDLKKNQRRWRYDVLLTPDDLVAISYPSVLGEYGLPAEEILQGLKEQDWVEPSTQNPILSCVDIENFKAANGRSVTKKAVVLNQTASEVFLVLIESTAEQIHKKQKIRREKKEKEQKTHPQVEIKSEESTTTNQGSKKIKRKPNNRKRKQKAALLANGAKIRGSETQPGSLMPLKKRIEQILLNTPPDIEWKESETHIYATLDSVNLALSDMLIEEGYDVTGNHQIVGIINTLQPDVEVKSYRRKRRVYIKKGSNNGS